MGDGRTDCCLSAEEAAGLRRRVADLERANERLSEQLRAGDRQRYEDLIENMNDIIYTTDREGNLRSVNQAVKRIMGFDPQEVIGTHYSRWMPKEDFDRLEATRPETLKGQRTTNQVVMSDREGNEHYVEISVSPLVVNGRIEGTQGIIRDITEQKKAQEDTRKFKTVFDKGDYGAAITDCSGNLLYVNETFAKMHGYRPAELAGRHLSVLHSQRQLPLVNRLNDRLMTEGSFVQEEVWHVRKDGTEFPTLMNGTLIRDDRGRALFWGGMAMDITERKRAEEEIKELQRQTEFVLGVTRTCLSIIDANCNMRFVDPAWQRIHGEYRRKKCHEYFHGAGHPCSECGIPRSLAAKQIVTHDGVLPREGNRPIQITTIPFQAEDGEWLVAEVCADITERKVLEQKLRDSEQRYRTIVETVGETIAIVDAQGVFQFMNTTAGLRLGGPPADFVGKTMWELFPREVADRQAAYIRDVIGSGQGKSVVSLSNVKGEPRWYCTAVEPLRDGAGKVTAGLVVARDVHALTTAQQELETYREKMIRAEHLASLGTLSAMLTHEMTQPLTVIRLSIQNAIQTLESTSPGLTGLEDLSDALAGTSDMTAIVERFRDFAGKMPGGTTGAVSLLAVARRVVRLLDESARKARVALDVDLPDDLPEIRSYGKEIEQVFFILAQNAVQAADGLRDHCFHICGAGRAGTVELQFADDCGGIAPKVLEHLFEPFVTTKPPGEGTGLGLCVVQRLVSQVGGCLRVDSRGGEGTTFFLTLPIERK